MPVSAHRWQLSCIHVRGMSEERGVNRAELYKSRPGHWQNELDGECNARVQDQCRTKSYLVAGRSGTMQSGES